MLWRAICRAQLLALMTMVAGDAWTQLSPPSSPAGRSRTTMLWDAVDQGIWMFGGQDVSDWSFSNDLYFFSMTANMWTARFAPNLPEGRWMHTAVLDTAARVMYVFGGSKRSLGATSPGTTFSDLFRYDMGTNTWTQLSSATVASSRHTAVWDGARARMIVYGGEADNTSKLGDIMEYFAGNDTWNLPAVSGTMPQPRLGHVAVWDAVSDIMLMSCGHGDATVYISATDTWSSTYNDLWSYSDGSGWIELVPSGSLTPRGEGAAVWDAETRSIMGFGGYFDAVGHMDSVFLYADSSWSEYTIIGPLSRDGHAAAWDPDARHLYTFGGWVGWTYEDKLWRLNTTHMLMSTTSRSSSVTSSVTATSTLTSQSSGDAGVSTSVVTSSSSPSVVDVLGELEQVEHQAARRLLTAIGSNQSNSSDNMSSGVLGNAVVEAGAVTVHAWALMPVPGPPLSLDAGSSGLRVPQEVVAQAMRLAREAGSSEDFVLLTAGTPTQAVSAVLEDSEQSLMFPPVSVNFRSANGQQVRMHSLERPLLLRFGDVAGQGGQGKCKFWDEEANQWSRKGVTRSDLDEAAGVACLTTHLTIFAVLLETAAQVLRCSTASEVLSADGLRNLGTVQWLSHAASILTLIAIGLAIAALAWGMYLDWQNARTLPTEEVEAALMLERRRQHLASQKSGYGSSGCCRCADATLWTLTSMFDVPATDSVSELLDAKVATVNRCISSVHAYRAGACRRSIKAAMVSSSEDELRRSNLEQKWSIHFHAALVVEKFLSSSWPQRVVMLLPCMHPWMTLRLVSFFRSHTVRTALVVLKLVGAAFTNALFFTSSAQAAGSDDLCSPPQTLDEKLLTATIVGFFSACLSDVLIVLLAIVQQRSVLYRDHWTTSMKKAQMRRWRVRRLIFWLVWFCAFVFGILYLLAFLASVSVADAARWLESTGMSVMQDMLLKPLILALGYATFSSLVLCSPRVRNAVEKRWTSADSEGSAKPADKFPIGNENAASPCKATFTNETESIGSDIVQNELV